MADRDQVSTKLAELQREFARLVRRIDQDELDFAVTSARAIANSMTELLAEIQSDFANDFKTHRFRTFPSDLASIEKFESTTPKREDLSELAAVAAHFFKHVRAVESLVKLTYPPKPFSIRPLIDKYGRIAVTTVGGLLLVSGLFLTVQHYRIKRVGLMARFFGDTDLKTPERHRQDGTINFNWGNGSPFRGWRNDYFSARWTGFLYVPFADKWEFTTYSDDGVRLFIADKLVISHWNDHGVARDTATLQLKEGYYPIALEYYDARGGASIRLLWRQIGESRLAVIPRSNFVPSVQYLRSGMPVFDTLAQDALIDTPSLSVVVPSPVEAPVPAPKTTGHKTASKAAPKTPAQKPAKAPAPKS